MIFLSSNHDKSINNTSSSVSKLLLCIKLIYKCRVLWPYLDRAVVIKPVNTLRCSDGKVRQFLLERQISTHNKLLNMEQTTIEKVELMILILQKIKENLRKSRGFFTSRKTKIKYNTHNGLCHLTSVITCSFYLNNVVNDKYTDLIIDCSVELRNLYQKYAHKFGGDLYRGHYWKRGKIKPRYKLVKAVIKELEHKKFLIEQRLLFEKTFHI